MSDVIAKLEEYAKGLTEIGETTGAGMLERRAATLKRAAEREEQPKGPVEISYEGDKVVLKTPLILNRSVFWAMTNKIRAIGGREWDKDAGVNRFPKDQEPAVMAVVTDFFAGHELNGPNGTVQIPAAD